MKTTLCFLDLLLIIFFVQLYYLSAFKGTSKPKNLLFRNSSISNFEHHLTADFVKIIYNSLELDISPDHNLN